MGDIVTPFVLATLAFLFAATLVLVEGGRHFVGWVGGYIASPFVKLYTAWRLEPLGEFPKTLTERGVPLRVERFERLLLNDRGQALADAARLRVLVNDQDAVAVARDGEHGILVERREAAQIEHCGLDAFR